MGFIQHVLEVNVFPVILSQMLVESGEKALQESVDAGILRRKAPFLDFAIVDLEGLHSQSRLIATRPSQKVAAFNNWNTCSDICRYCFKYSICFRRKIFRTCNRGKDKPERLLFQCPIIKWKYDYQRFA